MLQKSERTLLLVLAAIQFTNIVDFMIMMPMGDILKKELSIGPQQYGLLVSSYGIAAFVTAFAGVFYLDNLDRRKALLTAYFGFMLGTLSSAILPNTSEDSINYLIFIFTRVITGLTGGLLGGLVMSIIGDAIPIERRGRAMGVVTISFSLAAILGMPVALTLVDLFDNNWHVPFYGVTLLALPIWLLAFKSIPPMSEHLKNRTHFDRTAAIRLAVQSREQRNALLFTVLLVLGQFTVISFMTPYYINNVGLMQSDIKWIYLVGGAATVVSGFAIGRMVDRIGRFRVFTVAALLSIIPVLVITHLPHVPLWVVLVIAGFFFVLISGRMIPANTIATTVVNPEQRAGFMSLNSAMMSLASGSSGIISGLIISQVDENSPLMHYEWVGYLAAVSTILSLLVVRILKRIADEKAANAHATARP
ncbi:MAG: MFS transporter [Flavobacteriales bacterium]|jgi:predicted MFS family arabinose efflux permease